MMNLILFYLLVFVHHTFIILLILTPPFVIINEPFWIAIAICVWVLHLMFSPVLVCPATIWENVRCANRKSGRFLITTILNPSVNLLVDRSIYCI